MALRVMFVSMCAAKTRDSPSISMLYTRLWEAHRLLLSSVMRSEFRRSAGLFRTMVLATMVGSGCGGAAETPMQTRLACPPEGAARYSTLGLAAGIDGIEFRSRDPRTRATTQLATLGVVCKGATDPDACLKQVASTVASDKDGWSSEFSVALGPGPAHYAVATRGNDVILVKTPEALAKVVAPLDDASRALAFVKVTRDADVVCNANNVTKQSRSYVIKSIQHVCTSVVEVLYTITPDGIVTSETKVLDPGEEGVDC